MRCYSKERTHERAARHCRRIGFWYSTNSPAGQPPAALLLVLHRSQLQPALPRNCWPLTSADVHRTRVAVSLEVALAACIDAEYDPAQLPSVFTSTYGDQEIVDYMCTTLAKEPIAVSPTKFHNSVHNSAAAYWTIWYACTNTHYCTQCRPSQLCPRLAGRTRTTGNGYQSSACGRLR